MKFPRTNKYHIDFQRTKMMGPNAMRITEELLADLELRPTMTALDIGCGLGLSSLLVAKEFGMRVFACDLWIDPKTNFEFFKKINMEKQIIPMKVDFSKDIPFSNEYFNLILCVDAFHYFGAESVLSKKILPLLKKDGVIALSFPVLNSDEIPEVLHEWFGDEIEYMHTLDWWKKLFQTDENAEIISCGYCECHLDAWNDWFSCDANEFAQGDKKFAEKGALEHLNTAKFIIRHK